MPSRLVGTRNTGWKLLEPDENDRPVILPSRRLEMFRRTKDKHKDKKRRKFSKSDIGFPLNFPHLLHGGWDSDEVDNTELPIYHEFFTETCRSEKYPEQEETRQIIYHFINSHGILDVMKEETIQTPKPPAGTFLSSSGRTVPPSAFFRPIAPSVADHIPPPIIQPRPTRNQTPRSADVMLVPSETFTSTLPPHFSSKVLSTAPTISSTLPPSNLPLRPAENSLTSRNLPRNIDAIKKDIQAPELLLRTSLSGSSRIPARLLPLLQPTVPPVPARTPPPPIPPRSVYHQKPRAVEVTLTPFKTFTLPPPPPRSPHHVLSSAFTISSTTPPRVLLFRPARNSLTSRDFTRNFDAPREDIQAPELPFRTSIAGSSRTMRTLPLLQPMVPPVPSHIHPPPPPVPSRPARYQTPRLVEVTLIPSETLTLPPPLPHFSPIVFSSAPTISSTISPPDLSFRPAEKSLTTENFSRNVDTMKEDTQASELLIRTSLSGSSRTTRSLPLLRPMLPPVSGHIRPPPIPPRSAHHQTPRSVEVIFIPSEKFTLPPPPPRFSPHVSSGPTINSTTSRPDLPLGPAKNNLIFNDLSRNVDAVEKDMQTPKLPVRTSLSGSSRTAPPTFPPPPPPPPPTPPPRIGPPSASLISPPSGPPFRPPTADEITLGDTPTNVDDPRSALMKAIRSGTTLKPVDVNSGSRSVLDSRNAFLDQIRRGTQLSPVQPNSKTINSTGPQGSLARVLRQALAKRADCMQSDSSSESTSEDDEEWQEC